VYKRKANIIVIIDPRGLKYNKKRLKIFFANLLECNFNEILCNTNNDNMIQSINKSVNNAVNTKFERKKPMNNVNKTTRKGLT
jgi:hypothetical protein